LNDDGFPVTTWFVNEPTETPASQSDSPPALPAGIEGSPIPPAATPAEVAEPQAPANGTAASGEPSPGTAVAVAAAPETAPAQVDPDVEKCRRVSQIVTKLQHALGSSLTDDVLREGALKLGIRELRHHLEENEQKAVLFDYTIFHIRRGGRTAVEAYRAASTLAPGSEELAVLDAMCASRYSAFMIAEVQPNRVRLVDLLAGEDVIVPEPEFAKVVQPGYAVATRILPLGNVAVMAALVLPLNSIDLAFLGRNLRPLLGRDIAAGVKRLSPQKKAEMVKHIVRRAALSRAMQGE